MNNDKTNSMANEKLIESVSNKRPLWDRRNKAYYNREAVKQLWDEVSVETGMHKDVAKYKWRGLRDTFRKEIRKMYAGTSSTPSSWIYYNNMMFLIDQIVAPECKDILDCDTLDKEPEDHFLSLEETCSSHDESTPLTPIQLCEASLQDEQADCDVAVPEPVRKPNSDVKFLLSRKRKARDQRPDPVVPSDDEDASDYHFLMSLLPYMKAVRRKNKMAVRVKIQKILYDEEVARNGNESSGENVASSSQITHDDSDEDDADV